MELTIDQVKKIGVSVGTKRLQELLPHLNAALKEFKIDTPLRIAAFMAQVLHESGGFLYFEEIASGQAYEGRKDLGNTQVGDGKRYKGRGPVQISGRANYSKYGKILNLPLEDQPTLAALPEHGFRIAAAYWNENNLSSLADKNNLAEFHKITKKINGGFNGKEDRLQRYIRAKKVLGLN